MDDDELQQLRNAKRQLGSAVRDGRSRKWCLSLWSRFIRARDGHRCVNCEAAAEIQAHHIFRRAVLADASFELGNGITLCRKCHSKAHKAFNGRPTPGEPLNTRGGDDQDEIAYLFGILAEDADGRALLHDDFYFIGDHILDRFCAWQGFKDIHDMSVEGHISRLKAAHEIWSQAPEPWYSKVASDVGMEFLASVIHRKQSG